MTPKAERLRRDGRGIAGLSIPLVILVVLPVAVVAGVFVGLPTGGAPTPTEGASAISVTIRVSFLCLAPEVSASVSPPSVCALAPNTLHFLAEVTGAGPPYLVVWDFGDGSGPAFGQSLNHTFPSDGCTTPYPVTVDALTTLGSASNSTSVRICPP